VQIANELASVHGHKIDWKEHSYPEMESMRARIRMARFLASYYGHQLDWREYSVAEMQEIRSRVILANNLARRGHHVDWRNVVLPPDAYKEVESAVAKNLRILSRRSGVSANRLLAMLRKSLGVLQAEATDADMKLLTDGLVDIYFSVSPYKSCPIPECLVAYVDYRRNNADHATAVRKVIEEHVPRPAIVSMVGGSGQSVRWTISFKAENRRGFRSYIVWGEVVNLGKRELSVPTPLHSDKELEPEGTGTALLLLVDQEGREFSPMVSNMTVHPDSTLRPSMPSRFWYRYPVSRNSQVAAFKARDLEDEKNQFDDDPSFRIPITRR
jgi:hypothetical protein